METIKIYKISGGGDKFYIGSTKSNLSLRLNRHRTEYNRFLEGKRPNITSFEIVKDKDAKIELIKEVLAQDRDMEEQAEILKAGDRVVNRYNPVTHSSVSKCTAEITEYTVEQTEKFNNAVSYNSKCVLRNYYKYREQKLKQSALRRIRLSGILPKESTIEKYGISKQEIEHALEEYNN
jgi:hypothetical protein